MDALSMAKSSLSIPGSAASDTQQGAEANVPPTRPPTLPPSTLDTTSTSPKKSTLKAEKVQQAIQKLQNNFPASASVTLQAGLDPDGTHPGQVLVKLSDKVTKQTFFEYYVPAEQVVKSAETGDALQPGSLMSTKA
ncbi:MULTISPECIES: hypothetical protein [Acidithiobacillus]|uniref:hypothetical protein n=1 Tax=Acidithiobacillus TaxID=119977 RepID=UPI001D001B6C|nr:MULTISPECIES: hypothetical protein [Acidithiobacillus]MDD2748482.1 hypothetical protein [Acidithiobacillus sp.]MDD5278241.1 hypothetical protein [Acidithiobacillus sp.]